MATESDRDPAQDPSDPIAEVPATIGRYRVQQRLGSGGMGVVYRAHDGRLDRAVAIKVVRHDRHGQAQLARLLREAQAMARINHPHVLPVYGSGKFQGRVFVVMELVDGPSLAQWLREGEHELHEILDKLVQAGQGLLAAHAQGLIHRDFKPSNALVGPDGRVRVCDFGLARPVGSDEGVPSPPGAEPPSVAFDLLDVALTRPGGVVGTAAYMAPEQHEGATATARSDQYSFCVAVWEAVFGARPFDGAAAQLVRDKRAGPPTAPAGPRPSRRLMAALMRGLHPDPSRRHPTLEPLLAAMRRSLRRRSVAVSLGIPVLLATGVGAWAFAGPEPMCSGAAMRLDEVWWDGPRGRVREALSVFSPGTSVRVRVRVDGYVRAWEAARVEACHAARPGMSSGSTAVDDALTCLAGVRQSLEATVETLSRADAAVARHAVGLVRTLPPIERCAQIDARARLRPQPREEDRERVEQVRQQLAGIDALLGAQRNDEATERIVESRGDAIRIGYPPLVAEVGLRAGRVAHHRGEHADALAALEGAFFLARSNDARWVAAASACEIVSVLAASGADDVTAATWVLHARAALTGVDDPALGARLAQAEAQLARSRSDR
ncbi:MAG: serine/threonine protein kinase [Deltaproteobacteria bacterium]|nr:serine/threonine protein kinase [Deltaproteobacteria bacterium]